VSTTIGGKVEDFYNRGNEWMEGPDPQCQGYDECKTDKDRFSTEEPINYHIVSSSSELCFDIDRFPQSDPLVLFLRNSRTLNINNIHFACSKAILFHHSHFRPNADHRGSDHTQLILDWNESWLLRPTAGILTFRDLAEGLYRVKSHKFDDNYEMLFGAYGLKSNGGNCIRVTLNFDYGS
jgi:hypothetical protein